MFIESIANGRIFIQKMDLAELADSYKRELSNANKSYARECDPGRGYGNGSWYGGLYSIADAEKILKAGWKEGADKAMLLKERLEGIVPRAKSRKRRQIWAGEGDTLDVDRALVGQWDSAWRSTKREMVDGSSVCVTLTAGWGGNCQLTSDQLFWSGAVMLVVSDMLENAGYSTAINAVSKNTPDFDHYAHQIITIKAHGEPMRPDALAGVICHAGIFRSYGFRVLCNAPWNVGAGLGHMVDWKTADTFMNRAKYNPEDENTIRVNDCYSEGEAVKEIQRIVHLVQPNT